MTDHVKIGSAILTWEYFWSLACRKCTKVPEVCLQTSEGGEQLQLSPRKAAKGSGSHVFDLASPGLYFLTNFCGGGFRFDAKVKVTEPAVDVLHLQGMAEA